MPKLSEENNRSVTMANTEFEFEKILGSGSFGLVSLHKSKQQLHGKTHYLAVKTSDQDHHKSLLDEFKILSEFRGCSRIIKCYGDRVGERLSEKGIVLYDMYMEYAGRGNLKNFMERFKDEKLPEPLIKDFTRMLLEGLATIHKHGYVHCDLKPENILVFPSRVYKNGMWRRTYELKILDFDLTKRDGDNKWWSPGRPFVGTAIYMSPESISHGETRRGLDLWSLGCVVLEMFTGKRPWWHKEYCLKDLLKCYEPLIPDDLTPDAKLFLMTCFAPEPDERKDAMTLLGCSFLRGGDVDEINEPRINVTKNKNLMRIGLKLEKLKRIFGKVRV